jgi:hypothetical protein
MKRDNQPDRYALMIILFIFSIACTCSTTSLLGAATPDGTITEWPIVSTPSARESTSVEDEVAPTEESGVAGLTPNVPWLIVSSTDGLWAANMDGTNLVPLIKKPIPDINLKIALSSKTHQIAFLTSGADAYHGLTLKTISLPEGKVHKITNLTTHATEPVGDAAPGDPSLEAMRAIVEQPAFAWSPDGTMLAFIGALDEPKADVYVYSVASKKIQKVSGDEGQDFWPTWSPDGKSILYFSAEGFGSGAGMTMKGTWLAAADGSGSKLLETPKTGGEQMLGWRDAETAVLSSFMPGSGNMSRLRLFNIHTKKITVLNESQSFGAAVATGGSEDSGAILYSKSDGLYLLPVGSLKPQKLAADLSSSSGYPAPIRWEKDWRVFIVHFNDGNLSTWMADGTHHEDAPFNPSTGRTDVGAFGMIWGWTTQGGESEGTWISGPGLETVQISTGSASAPVWNIDNDLLFFNGDDLFRSTFNSRYSDTAAVASLTGNVLEAAWVGFGEALDIKYGS